MLKLLVNLWIFLVGCFGASLTKHGTSSAFYGFVVGFCFVVFLKSYLVAAPDNFTTRQYLLQIVKSD